MRNPKHTPTILALLAMLLFVANGLRAQETFSLVTDASVLAAGDRIVIANNENSVAMSTVQNTNNRGQVAVTIADGVLTSNDNVQVLTLGGSAGQWTFDTGSGYLYMAGGSSKNYLRTQTSVDANAQATITIASDGAATVQFNGTGTHNTLRYNTSASLFSCYTSLSSVNGEINIYRAASSTPAVGRVESIADWNALDDETSAELYLADGLNARVVYASNDTVMLKDNTGIMMMVGVTTNPTLFFGAHVAGYIHGQKTMSDQIPTFKPTTQTNSAFFVIAEPVTEGDVQAVTPMGIENLEEPTVQRGRIYNLDGQYMGNSVQGLQPGIYIRDGRKLIIK
jgi:hypothetical protein